MCGPKKQRNAKTKRPVRKPVLDVGPKQLKILFAREADYQVQKRLRTLSLLAEGFSQRKAAALANVGGNALSVWRRIFQEGGIRVCAEHDRGVRLICDLLRKANSKR